MLADKLAAAVLAVLLQALPPDRTAALHARQYPENAESAEARAGRYGVIAAAVAGAALEQAPDAPLWPAALLAAVAERETRLDPDTDAQRCWESRIRAPGPNCDGGRAGHVWQLHEAPTTREEAARTALRRYLAGMRQCARLGLPREERLSGAFLGRGCENARGRTLSRDRIERADRLELRLRQALAAASQR